ncbi:hypothetical protein HN587_04005 [Candidatus Woesearchaeota archaeon]|jgi:hypothetical protein|nr:hypothetical protein [Candidatus Woesearchaeota archaeon]
MNEETNAQKKIGDMDQELNSLKSELTQFKKLRKSISKPHKKVFWVTLVLFSFIFASFLGFLIFDSSGGSSPGITGVSILGVGSDNNSNLLENVKSDVVLGVNLSSNNNALNLGVDDEILTNSNSNNQINLNIKQDDGSILKFVNKKKHFTLDDELSFDVELEPNLKIYGVSLQYGSKLDEIESGTDLVEFENSSDLSISEQGKNKKKLLLKKIKKRSLKAGFYQLNLIYELDGQYYENEQNFTWGVLAVNTHKSRYFENETAFLGIVVLDDDGDMVCDSNVSLQIISPEGSVEILSTDNGKIFISDECTVYGITNLPDYYGYYTVAGKGIYELNLTAKTFNGIRSVSDYFVVQKKIDYDIERIGPTRIYPAVKYNMSFLINSDKKYTGYVQEFVPSSFEITPQQGMEISEWDNETLSLKWLVDLKKDDSTFLTYQFDAPDRSPDLFIVGPLFVGSFFEARQWKIGSDAITVGNQSFGSCECGLLEFEHNATGTGSVLIVGIGLSNGSSQNRIENVTFGGVPLSRLIEKSNSDSVRVDVWYLIEPPPGVYNVSIDILGSEINQISSSATSYEDINTFITFQNVSSTSGTGTSSELEVFSENDDLIIDFITWEDSIISAVGQTEQWNLELGGEGASGENFGGSMYPGNPGYNMSWTSGSSSDYSHVAFNLNSDIDPPGVISNLANQSAGYDWAYWNWTNPSDIDFMSNLIFINGTGFEFVNLFNTSNNWANVSGLVPGENYTIFVYSVDDENNINNTNISDSALTIYTEPAVILISPDDSKASGQGNVALTYDVDSEFSIDNCSLLLDDVVTMNEEIIDLFQSNQFNTSELNSGEYSWQINCTDLFGHFGLSESRLLYIIRTDNFDGETTNLANVSNVSAVSNFVVESVGMGGINFTENLDLSSGLNLNSLINISQNYISVDSASAAQLNKQARLILHNLSFLYSPVIVKDDQLCLPPTCELVSYSESEEEGSGIYTLIFDVLGFSAYTSSTNSQLNISDDVDYGLSAYDHDLVGFYANYTNKTNGVVISNSSQFNGSCNISFNVSPEGPFEMEFNFTGDDQYYYETSFLIGTTYDWNVTCMSDLFENLNVTDNIVIIPNYTLPIPDLIYPLNNQTNLTLRTPTFYWNASYGYSNLTYELNITGGCGPLFKNNISELNYTLLSELGTEDECGMYYWQVRSFNETNYSSWSPQLNFSIAPYISFVLLNSNVDFGFMNTNEVKDTTNYAPMPFILENTGNILGDLSIAGTALFEYAEFPGENFQIKTGNTSEKPSFNWGSSKTEWVNVSNVSQIMIFDFDYFDLTDSAEIDVRIHVSPGDLGYKNNSITFQIAPS